VAVNKAVSDTLAPATLIRDPSGPESFLGHVLTDGAGVQVDSVTLDAFLKARGWPNVDLIKMND
jgi:hypothetical protein